MNPVESPWFFSSLFVKKKEGQWRVVANFRRLNDITKKYYFPLPKIEDALHSLQAKWFSTIDYGNAFWQISSREADNKKVAFSTHRGTFAHEIMAMCLCAASSSFQALMNVIVA